MPKIALIHDWLTGMRGGEYVVEAISEVLKKPEMFTLVSVPNSVSPELISLPRHTSFLQKMPGVEKRYRHFLPLMPKAIESFDLTGYDLVVSSSHCVAKGVRKPKDALHVCYIHAPMRYMWDRYDDYFGKGRASPLVRLAARSIRSRMQKWDFESSRKENVDYFIANSQFIADQVKSIYRRDSEVIHPFADMDFFSRPRKPSKSYLMVGAFAPYKRVDLAIEAFNRLKLPLYVVGDGQEAGKLKKLAGPTVEFLGGVSRGAIADLFSKCRAFVFPGKEDFGITPVEAMAAGAPVIAFGEGGALETVSQKTGIFFPEQTVESLMRAIEDMERRSQEFLEDDCRKQASLFTRNEFQRKLRRSLSEKLSSSGRNPSDYLKD